MEPPSCASVQSGHSLAVLWHTKAKPNVMIKKIAGKVDRKTIEMLSSKKGGMTKEALAILGVPWPPPKGWKKRLLKGEAVKPKRPKPQRQKAPPRNAKKDKFAAFYTSADWAKARYNALEKNDGRCECCGRGKHDGVILHVDHIKNIRDFWGLRLDRGNHQVLCNTCNWGKGNRYSTDWRRNA